MRLHKRAYHILLATENMTDDTSQIEAVLSQLKKAGVAYTKKIPGAREKLMSLSYDLISRLESPSEAIMRMGWAEVSLGRYCLRLPPLSLFLARTSLRP